jgi:pimeloyl-ACP methyl ester carboxylesterase
VFPFPNQFWLESTMHLPPVLLIHGFASSFEHGWQRHGWIDLLADEDRSVLKYDLPGHGERVGADACEFTDIANQLWNAMTNACTLDIVGFSAGARVALRMAALQPGRVRRLAVVGPNDSFLSQMDTTQLIAALQSDTPSGSAAHITLSRLARTSGNNVDSLVTFLRNANESVTPEMLNRITMPTLAITGSQDERGDAADLRSHMPDCTHIEIAGCDHFRLPSDPRTIDQVLSFLKS